MRINEIKYSHNSYLRHSHKFVDSHYYIIMSKKILLIEDEEILVDLYKFKFAKEGLKLITAFDGEEGLKLAREIKPDLILLDVVMPGIDGFQVLKELRGSSQTKDIKVYILSNLGQAEEINRGLEEGADGYIIKANITPAELVENVRRILAGKKVDIKCKTLPGS